MPKHYISAKLREHVVSLVALGAVVGILKEDEARNKELFGEGWRYIKQAGTLVVKGFQVGLRPNIGDEEAKKIHEVVKKSRVVVMRKSIPMPVEYTQVKTDNIFELAELAMGEKCQGCTIEKYRECSLYKILDGVELPRACFEKNKCPYSQ
jgi:hypothetical protein